MCQKLSNKTRQFLIVQFSVTYLNRPHCRKRENLSRAAVNALREAIGDGEKWMDFTVHIICMIDAKPELRNRLYHIIFDILHDIMCEEYPDLDDGERYYYKGVIK